jgi:hypothetical protein
MVCGCARAEDAQSRKEADQRRWLIELVYDTSTHPEADYLLFICATFENLSLIGGVEGPGGEGILCSRSLVYWRWPGRYLPSWFQWLPSQELRAGAEEGEATPAEEVIPPEEATLAEADIPGRVEGSPAEEATEDTPAEEAIEDTPVAEEATGGTPAEEVTTVGAIMTGDAGITAAATMADAGYPSGSIARRITGMVQALAAGTTISGVIGSHPRATTIRMAIMAIS